MKYPVIIAALLVAAQALATEPGDTPPGVEGRNWIRVTENLGFVVVSIEPTATVPPGANADQLLLHEVSPSPPAVGYFMVRSANGWRRLLVMTPTDIAIASKP